VTLLYIEAEIKRAVKKIAAGDMDKQRDSSELKQRTKEIVEKMLDLDTNVSMK
jgi:hypothetical protein